MKAHTRTDPGWFAHVELHAAEASINSTEASITSTKLNAASVKTGQSLCGSGDGFHESSESFHGNQQTSELFLWHLRPSLWKLLPWTLQPVSIARRGFHGSVRNPKYFHRSCGCARGSYVQWELPSASAEV